MDQQSTDFKTGDELQMKVADGDWLAAKVDLASRNGNSLAVSVEEGVPAPFGLKDGRQILLVSRQGDRFTEFQGNREVFFRR